MSLLPNVAWRNVDWPNFDWRSVDGAIATTLSPVSRAWRRRVLQRATDITEASALRSALVVAPHPDDETLGCGATTARKRAHDTPVHLLIVSDGRHANASTALSADELAVIRAAEAREAAARLGVEPDAVQLLGLPDGALSDPDHVKTFADTVRGLMSSGRFDQVLAPSPLDGHPDHQAVGLAVRGLREQGLIDCELLEYPIWSWVRGPWYTMQGSPAHRLWRLAADPVAALGNLPGASVVATGEYLATKTRAVEAYRTQVTNFTGEPGWAFLDRRFLSCFLTPQEVFFVPPASR